MINWIQAFPYGKLRKTSFLQELDHLVFAHCIQINEMFTSKDSRYCPHSCCLFAHLISPSIVPSSCFISAP